MLKKYLPKNAVSVEAIQFDGTLASALYIARRPACPFADIRFTRGEFTGMCVETVSGIPPLEPGDWVVFNGGSYPSIASEAAFRASYREAE